MFYENESKLQIQGLVPNECKSSGLYIFNCQSLKALGYVDSLFLISLNDVVMFGW